MQPSIVANYHIAFSARVPLIMSFPGQMPANHVVKQHVSHVDLHDTILDYLGGLGHSNSDGKSLRRFINGRSYNKGHDEQSVVVEIDERVPKSSKAFDNPLGKCLQSNH